MVMELKDVSAGIDWQADHAEKAGAPCTARVIRAQQRVIVGNTRTGRRMHDWPDKIIEDALPLRLTGGLHNLVLTGADDRLVQVYSGAVTDQTAIDALVVELVEKFDDRLYGWLDGPPQTNEAGRSWAFMAGLLWLSQRLGPDFEMFELGASAGVNTMMDRYTYDLGGVRAGPSDSPMRIAPEWRGPPPPAGEVRIASIAGCDQAPVDLADPAQAMLLKSYVWPEAVARMERIDAAIALAKARAPDVVKQDAGPFVDAMLAAQQSIGVVRVLFYSIVWQYIPAETRAHIEAAMIEAGANATAERPLAWISLETNRETFRHELTVRYWPDNGESQLLGCGHPHGAWAEWFG